MEMSTEEILKLAEQRGLEITKEEGDLCFLYNAREEYYVCLNKTNGKFTVYFAVGEPENIVSARETDGFDNKETFARMVYTFKQSRQIARRAWIRKHGLK